MEFLEIYLKANLTESEAPIQVSQRLSWCLIEISCILVKKKTKERPNSSFLLFYNTMKQY